MMFTKDVDIIMNKNFSNQTRNPQQRNEIWKLNDHVIPLIDMKIIYVNQCQGFHGICLSS